MAVTSPRQTESIASSKRRAFYPAHIPIPHFQLRQLLSSPSSHPSSPSSTLIYYASDSDIFRLDTATCTRERIVSLPYIPRCIAADHGWVVAGGENDGQFTAVQLCDTPNTHRDNFYRDSPLTRWTTSVATFLTGQSIVNSVTMHGCKNKADWGHDGPVAIITNNDRTVRIYHLPTTELIDKLEFEIQMNHASISPSGKLLVAVGDKLVPESNPDCQPPVVYFFRRVVDSDRKKKSNSSESEIEHPYRWVECENSFDIGMDSCFCSTFSPSGALCAVGSQDSRIVVYNTSLVDTPDKNPIVAVFQSSQPGRSFGAIRSLNFVHGPWDLLAWTEHKGRAGIADARDGFASRQHFELKTNPDLIHIMNVQEEIVPLEEQSIDPQLREDEEISSQRRYRPYMAQGDAAAARFAEDSQTAYYDRMFLQRPPLVQRPGEGLLDNDSESVEHTRQLADSLRSSNRDSPSDGDHQIISINYVPPTQASNRQSTLLANAEAQINSVQDSSMSPIPYLREYVHAERRRRGIREASTGPPREADGAASRTSTETPNSLSLPQAITASNEMSLPSALTASSTSNPEAWRTIEAAMASPPLTESNPGLRRQRELELETLRRHQDATARIHARTNDELMAQLERDRSQEIEARLSLPPNYRERSRMQDARSGIPRRLRQARQARDPVVRSLLGAEGDDADHPVYGPGSSGCAMSPDGRRVFFATIAGILQIDINVEDRRFFPNFEPI